MIKRILRYVKYIALVALGVAGLYNLSGATYVEFPVGEFTQVSDFTYEFDDAFNFSTDGSFVASFYGKWNTDNISLFSFSWYNNDLYFYSIWTSNGEIKQGYLNNWCIGTYGTNCVFDKTLEDVLEISPIITSVKFGGNNTEYFNNTFFRYYQAVLCFNDGTLDYCVQCGNGDYCDSGLSGSLNLNYNTFNDLIQYDWDLSPFDISPNPIINVPIEVGTGNGLDGYVYIPINTGDYINYYENERGFNSDICYIGTTDLTSNYGTGIQYFQGSGYTIFDFYSHLFNTSNISITEEGTFINTWIVNYDTFFLGLNRDVDGNPWFVDFYNGPGDYGVNRGPGLTSPFTNNLIAYYFLSSTIRDLISDNGSIGEEVALYCYKKGLGGYYSIVDNHNSVYDNWVGVYARNERNSGYFGSSGEEIVGQSWHGTPLDEMDWYDFTGYEDMDFKTFLSSAFNQFKVNYGTFDSSAVGLGALPTYIVMFLMALIFFRFISH